MTKISELIQLTYEKLVEGAHGTRNLDDLEIIAKEYPDAKFRLSITGSAGLGLATASELPFVQEVFGAFIAVKESYPDADVVIELGGEDAKILFLTGGMEVRMNGTCAGGTGAFIDQMATLLNVPIEAARPGKPPVL